MTFLLAAAASLSLLLDSGSEPALSHDGKTLAYVTGEGDLWIRPAAGGTARLLAHDAHEPSLSPDGEAVVYRRGGNGGIHMVLAAGRAARLLARDGRHPRFSPDGRLIAYDTGAGLFVLEANGAQPRRIHASGTHAAWSADGQRLVFQVCATADACDWWTSRVDGSQAALAVKGRPSPPDAWLSNGRVLFTDKHRLWTLDLNGGAPQRLTSADRDERNPATAGDGRIVYASRAENVDVYLLPLDADRARTHGPLTRVTTDASVDQRPTLSLDGKHLAWETSRGGNFEVWVKDLASGQERAVTNGPLREHMPTLSRDGAKLLYDAHDGDTVTVLEASFAGGEPVKIWEENVGQGSFQWSADGASALYFHRAPPGTVGLMNLTTKQRTPLLRHPKLNLSLADARLSPDGRAIAFPVPYAPHRSRLAVAQIVAGKVIEDEREWTWRTPAAWNAAQPEWSPNGAWLYFLGDQSGELAIYATKGSATRLILKFPRAGASLAEMRPRDIGLAVAKDKLAFGATAYTSQLWSAGSIH